MADDPYASIAKPIDPYADIAKPVGVAAHPAPIRASTFGGGMIEGAKDLGQGIMDIPQAILHPVNAFNAIGAQQRALADRASADAKAGHYGNAIWHGIDAMLPGLGPLDAQLTDEYQSGTPGAKSAAMGRTLVNALPSVATEGARPILTKVVPRIGAAANNVAIGADADYGANAGRGMYNAGVVGNSSRGILKQVNRAAGEAANAHNADLTQYGGGQQFSLRPAINQPFDDAIAAKTDPKVGAVTPAQVVKARQVQGILNSAQDPATGRPLQVGLGPNGRDLTSYTPVQANKLKSNIYGMTDYDDPHNNSLANNALKGAASNIKQVIDTNVPESVASGQHLHDLMSASDALKGGGGVELSRGGIIDAATKAGLTSGAQALRLGVNAVNSGPGRLLSRVAPVLAPRTPLQPQEPVDWPYQDEVEQPDQQNQDNGDANDNSNGNLPDQHATEVTTPAAAPPTLKPIDRQTAEGYYDQAGGDPDAARELAAKDGYDISGGNQ